MLTIDKKIILLLLIVLVFLLSVSALNIVVSTINIEAYTNKEAITNDTRLQHSYSGEVVDHATKEVIPAYTPRYILMWTNGKRGEFSGHYYKSLESIRQIYCN